MRRICCILLVAGLWGCRHHHPVPVRIQDPVGGTVPPPSTAGAVDTPPASRERSEAPASPGAATTDKLTGVAPKDVNAAVREVNAQLKDALFDYDRSAMRPDAVDALRQDAALLIAIIAEFPQVKVTVEGHCDERGSAEYNLGLGDHRADAAVHVLRGFGVPSANLETISYGKERPQCTELKESCWRLNRRAHLSIRPPGPTE